MAYITGITQSRASKQLCHLSNTLVGNALFKAIL